MNGYQFVAWCSSDRIRERILQEPVTKSLDELATIAVTIERAMAETPALMEPNSRRVNNVRSEVENTQKPTRFAQSCRPHYHNNAHIQNYAKTCKLQPITE